ncbi:MFS transporter [Streptomyces sp. NBC_01304]|uniref:MFS transporter n=1 Tax=Streptomyces sp. NBC_01304 TaxID=2903818 RepID=UPI002E0F3705|nr:MFS transporter [Streptomyces sp. NBC_01304]
MSTTAARLGPTGQAVKGTTRRWPAAIWTLMVATFLVRGFGFTYPFLPYHLDHLDLSTRTVSTVLAVFGAGWLLGSILCGWLADRIGHRTTLITAMLLATAALPLLAQVRATTALFAATFIAGIVYDASRPVFTAAIAETFPDDRVRASVNAWRHFAVNVGAAVAGALGGLLAARIGIPALIWINAAACALVAFLVWQFLRPDRPHQTEANAGQRRTHWRTALHDQGLWLLVLASLAALTCASSLFSAMPMLMADDNLTAADYGWTQVANAGAVLALSPFLNRWLSHRADQGQPMTGLFAAGSLVLGTSMGAAGFASTTAGYSVAAALAVPGEIVLFVGATDILNRLSPPDARGLYAGIWGTTLAGAVIIAPALAGWALTHGGGALCAAATFTAGLTGAALCLPLAQHVRRPALTHP